ncbi:hypothetical protein IWQ60_008696 [Tieghemiomyces parasiticus]|uniref:Septin-type G domain-containing protein n=1 Tax=Tieghemiomyces parasiticus TaxID=78921 RepID=A0A9W8DL60_9FUNG|nr:hypothetical protein IWQ60_008696 [Tieghemiomyces parasiticus]
MDATVGQEYALQNSRHRPEVKFWKTEEVSVTLHPDPALGISYLEAATLERIHRRPITLNVMVVGAAGLGKSTLINSFFQSDLVAGREDTDDLDDVRVTPYPAQLEEDGVNLHLTALDTVGLHRTDDLVLITDYLDTQYHQYMVTEHAPRRPAVLPDTRVHLIFYLLQSGTRGRLTPFDRRNLQALSAKANVVPLLAKADIFTPEERHQAKLQVSCLRCSRLFPLP